MIDDTIVKIFVNFKDFYRQYLTTQMTDSLDQILCHNYKNIIDLEVMNYLLALNQEKSKIDFNILSSDEEIINNIQNNYTYYDTLLL